MSTIKIPKIYFNAEFQRLVWLNFSLPLLCVILFCYVFFGYDAFYEYDGLHFENLQMVAWIGFWISNGAIAIMLQRSFKQDISSQFWDQLRMSTLTSWQLSWTRLFITPILAWASILICMLMMYSGTMIANIYQPNSSAVFSDYFNEHIFYFVLMMPIMMPMLSICFASLFIINELQFKRSQYEWHGSYFQLVLLGIVGGLFLNHVLLGQFNDNSDLKLLPFLNYKLDTHIWHLFSYILLATMISLFLLNKSMSYKLHLKPTNFYWLIIAISLPYILLFIDSLFLSNSLTINTYDYNKETYLDTHFAKSSVLLYYFGLYSVVIYSVVSGISLICQDNQPKNFILAQQYAKTKQWRKLLDILPTWVILLPITLITIGVLSLLIPMINADFYKTVIQQNPYDIKKQFSWLNIVQTLMVYIGVIFGLYHISRVIAPRFNSVNLSLIGFILLYVMWQILTHS